MINEDIRSPEFREYLAKTQPNICRMTILKNGRTILDDCWNGYKTEDTVHTTSVTKSIVSLLVGIAIEKGLIGSVDDRILDYFPVYRIKRGEKTIQHVTIRHLLTMTAPYKYKSEPWTRICVQNDWTTAALDFVGGRSGITGEYRYSTLGIHILTGIIAVQSGLSTVDFANKYLFAPLGIADRKCYIAPDAAAHKAFTLEKTPKGQIWFSDPMGVGTAGYGLCLSSGEMAKIGQLCLQNGAWGEKQLIPETWLRESTETKVIAGGAFQGLEYGFLWWIIDNAKHIFAAIGHSGNVIYIESEKEIIAAIASSFKPSVSDRISLIRELTQQL